MRARNTWIIGIGLLSLSSIQLALERNPVRLIGIAVGLGLIVFGWKIGWTRFRNLTAALGHAVLAGGCLATAFAVYQLPFLDAPPNLLETLDLPLFWGLFMVFGGYCMITHSYCACAMKMHNDNQIKKSSGPQ